MKTKIIAIILLNFTFYSCKKEKIRSELLETPMVLTYYDTDINFSQYNTFYLVDSIGVITDDQSVNKKNAGSDAKQILSKIKSQMNERGYTYSTLNTAHIGILVSVVYDLNLSQGESYSPGYWWGYDGYYNPVYWGYTSEPYYYNYDYNYVYRTGSLLIELIDLKNASQNNKLKVIWNAEIGDIYNSNINLQTALESVEQAFTQSIYLKK